MKDLGFRYKKHFKDKTFVISLVVALGFLILSLIVNFYAGTYATESASAPVTDIILSNIPVYNVDTIFIYGPVFLWLLVLGLILYEPKKIPFVLKNIALFLFIRSLFITLTHIGPFPDQIPLDLNPANLFNKFSFAGDLFFSSHTGSPFLMALVFWDNKFLRVLFMIIAIFFGVIVLLGHFHYSIDVLSAFFITYTIYHIAEKIFKKDKLLFEEEAI